MQEEKKKELIFFSPRSERGFFSIAKKTRASTNILYVLPSEKTGFAVAVKKNPKLSAVQRNTLKRRFRACIRKVSAGEKSFAGKALLIFYGDREISSKEMYELVRQQLGLSH